MESLQPLDNGIRHAKLIEVHPSKISWNLLLAKIFNSQIFAGTYHGQRVATSTLCGANWLEPQNTAPLILWKGLHIIQSKCTGVVFAIPGKVCTGNRHGKKCGMYIQYNNITQSIMCTTTSRMVHILLDKKIRDIFLCTNGVFWDWSIAYIFQVRICNHKIIVTFVCA